MGQALTSPRAAREVLSLPDYVEGECLKASMDFIGQEFGLADRFEGPGTLLSAVRFLRNAKLRCAVRAKALLRLRLRFAFWMEGEDVRVVAGPASLAHPAEVEAKLHLIYCHYLYRLPPTEGWWHYVVEMKRGGEVSLFDSFLMRAKETFGEASVVGYPAVKELDSLSEVSLSISP